MEELDAAITSSPYPPIDCQSVIANTVIPEKERRNQFRSESFLTVPIHVQSRELCLDRMLQGQDLIPPDVPPIASLPPRSPPTVPAASLRPWNHPSPTRRKADPEGPTRYLMRPPANLKMRPDNLASDTARTVETYHPNWHAEPPDNIQK